MSDIRQKNKLNAFKLNAFKIAILYVKEYIINTRKYKIYNVNIIRSFSTHQLRVLTKNRVKKSVFVYMHKKRTFWTSDRAKPGAKFV